MLTEAPKLIALTGYARAGKDMLANHLIQEHGFIRMNFGDFIKEFYDDFLQGKVSPDDLETAISERLYSEKSEEDLKKFMSELAVPYSLAGRSINAFTEDDALKKIIRPILEHGGELIYGWVLDSYNRTLDEYVAQGRSVINTRLCQLPEAGTWTERGGIVVLVDRKDHPPASEWDREIVDNLDKHGYISLTVMNNAQTGEQWDTDARRAANRLASHYSLYQAEYGEYLLNHDRPSHYPI